MSAPPTDLPNGSPGEPVRLSIQLVLWNSAAVVDAVMESLAAQTSRAFEVIVVDNASADDSADRAERWMARGLRGRVVRSAVNTGFCGGHNLAYREGVGDWALQLNPDVELAPDFVARAVATADAQPADVGTIAPLILLMDGCVDSTGLFMDRYGRLTDRGQGEPLAGRWQEEEDVPACCAAVALHRRAMLADLAQDHEGAGQPFDEALLWMYYDDYDAGVRAWRRGWRVRYVPSLVAHHGRAGRNGLRRMPTRRRRSVEQTLMVRNRFLMLAKVEPLGGILRRLPWLVPFELARLAYLAVKAPATLRGYPQALARLPEALRARRRLAAGARRPASVVPGAARAAARPAAVRPAAAGAVTEGAA